MLDNNWISDVRTGCIAFQQGLDCLLRGNHLVGVTLGFGDGSTNIRVESNRWTKMNEHQPSVKASNGSRVLLGDGNQRDGKDSVNSFEIDKTSVVK